MSIQETDQESELRSSTGCWKRACARDGYAAICHRVFMISGKEGSEYIVYYRVLPGFSYVGGSWLGFALIWAVAPCGL
jgi:hypothetical protein